MSSLEYVEDYEQDLESKEDEVEETTRQLESVNERLDAIEEAINKLGDDKQLQELVTRENKDDAQDEREKILEQRSQLQAQIEMVECDLVAIREANEASSETIDELEQMGEDVSEARTIIAERADKIQRGTEMARRLLEQLQKR